MTETISILFLAGMIGAVAKDILDDNSLQLPSFKDGKFFLGCLGGAIIGGIAGVLVDNNPMVAFTAGYTGVGVAGALSGKKETETEKKTETNEEIIRRVAAAESVDPELAVRVAKCESSLNEKAVNVNTDESIDRGLYQINSKYHPEVTEAEAFDPEFSAKFFCKAFKAGNLSWWNATKTCWNK